jgi:hypothetical protein
MHFLYSVNYELTASTCFKQGLEALLKQQLVYCVRVTSGWLLAGLEFHSNSGSSQQTHRQYTNCCLCSAS